MRDDGAEFRAWEAAMCFQVPQTGRQGRPVTTTPVARALGVSPSTVHRLRRGECPPTGTVRQLMRVLRWCKERGLHPPTDWAQTLQLLWDPLPGEMAACPTCRGKGKVFVKP